MDDLVWHSGGPKAGTFHRIGDGERRTMCGRPVGERVGDEVPRGAMQPRGDAVAAERRECRSCFGHAQTRKPIIEGRRNEP